MAEGFAESSASKFSRGSNRSRARIAGIQSWFSRIISTVSPARLQERVIRHQSYQALMSETFEYVERRLEPQRKWHNEKATWNKRWFYTVEVATLLAGAAIPIVNLGAVKNPYWAGVLSAILGGVVVVAASVGKLFKF